MKVSEIFTAFQLVRGSGIGGRRLGIGDWGSEVGGRGSGTLFAVQSSFLYVSFKIH